MAKQRLIICRTCNEWRFVRFGFMKDCHDCTKVRELRTVKS